jgi:hypothetical protein
VSAERLPSKEPSRDDLVHEIARLREDLARAERERRR